MAAAAANTASGGRGGVGGDSGCSTPFVSAPSSPARDPSFHLAAAGCYFSAPASPARGAGDGDHGYEYELDFDFDFSSRFPSPAAAAMSSADELFHNGQIRPMRLSSFLLRPQALPPHAAALPAGRPRAPVEAAATADERGRFRSRSVHRRSRSLSPFRTHWMSPSSSSSPAPAKESVETPTSASRSSSSSSTASSASSSSSSSRSYRRWRFLKDLVHRSKSDGGGKRPLPQPSPPVPKRNPSQAPARGRARRRSAHERLYEARRAEAEDMRRRTFLPYRQGLLLGCLGLGSRGYGAMHGFAAAAAAKSRA